MKKKITLSIDEDVYEDLGNLPRGVSISEVMSWTLRFAIVEIKLGREMTEKELSDFIEKTPGGRDYRERLSKHWGPGLRKIEKFVNKLSEPIGKKRK